MSTAGRAWTRRPTWLAPLVVGLVAAAWIRVVEATFMAANASWLPSGFRIHDMTANNSQQTLDIMDINVRGITFAWYSHVYPPLLDLLRYALAAPEIRSLGEPNGDVVDMRLYWLFAVLQGVMAAIVYLWVRDLTRNGWWALVAAALWCVSPMTVTVMTLLEPTPLSMALVAVMFYLLYRFLRTRRFGYSTAFFLALLVASWSRNVVQVHWFVVLLAAVVCFWFLSRNRSAGLFAMNLVLVALIFFWPVRAFVMFGTWDVSTHTGYHRAGALWIDPRTAPEPSYPFRISDNALAFTSRFNTQPQMAENYKLGLAANQFMVQHPAEAATNLGKSLQVTIPNAFTPVTQTTTNYLVQQFWWTAPYEAVFSGWVYFFLAIGSLIVIAVSRGWSGTLGLLRRYGWFAIFWILVAIPVLFSNRYWPPGNEDAGPIHTEAARLKALLEIPVYVVIVYALWVIVEGIRVKRVRSAEGRTAA